MDKIKGCNKHELAKQGCQICNGKIGTYHGRQKKIAQLQGMLKAYGPDGNADISNEISELLAALNVETL